MDRRTLLATAAGALGLFVVGYAVFAPANDEEMIRETLDRLAAGISFSEPIQNPIFYGSHLAETFDEVFTESVQISVAEVRANIPSHRGKLGLATAQVLQRSGSLDVSFGSTDIDIQGDSARVVSVATVSGNDGGQLRRDSRRVDFDFVKDGGDWRIARARVRHPE